MASSLEKRYLLGIAIDEYPEPCQTCEALAGLVYLLDDPDLTELLPYYSPDEKRNRQIARMVFPYLDICSNTCCGLRSAYAVQSAADLK